MLLAVAGAIQCIVYVLTTFISLEKSTTNFVGLLCLVGYFLMPIIAFLGVLGTLVRAPDSQMVAFYWMFRVSFRIAYLFFEREEGTIFEYILSTTNRSSFIRRMNWFGNDIFTKPMNSEDFTKIRS